MDPTLGPGQADVHQDSRQIQAAEEALSELVREATAIASDRRTDMGVLMPCGSSGHRSTQRFIRRT
jgi:hypothetical protein